MNSIIKNNKGLTLIELTISVLVASMLISMLLSLLTMSLKAKANLDVENKIYMESHIIAEKIRFNIFTLQAQSIQLFSDDEFETVIHITHDYDIIIDPVTHIITRDPNPVLNVLIYDKVTNQITYDGQLIHSANVLIDEGSSIELIAIDSVDCDVSVVGTICQQAVIKLTLSITVVFDNGSELKTLTLITEIIV